MPGPERFPRPATSLCIALLLSLASPGGAHARYASIVIEAANGKVLEERNAGDLNRPASLAKMMTLYLAFEALRQHRIDLETALPVSPTAAGQPASKLGLVAGERVPMRELILALIIKSANDAAVTVAEGLAVSEPLFAERMTAKARTLGMTQTVFRNASGLPDPEQVTSARDLATLAQALCRDFPDEYRLFATERFDWRGASFATHNTLMAAFAGMDGIKTGYIHESGFNLAASAVRDGRRLIAVVMGGDTAEARDVHTAQLLEDAFAGRPSDEVVELAARNDGIPARLRRIIAALSPVGHAEAAVTSAAPVWRAAFGRFKSKGDAGKAAAIVARQTAGRAAVQATHKGKAAGWRALVITDNAAGARSACAIAGHRRWRCAIEDVSAAP